MKTYTISFFTSLDSACANFGLSAFFDDCVSALGFNVSVNLLPAYEITEIQVTLDSDTIYKMDIYDAMSYILRLGKRCFNNHNYSVSFFACYGNHRSYGRCDYVDGDLYDKSTSHKFK